MFKMYMNRCFVKILENIFFKFKEIYVLIIAKKIGDYNILDWRKLYEAIFLFNIEQLSYLITHLQIERELE